MKEVGVADCLSVRNELREKSQAFEQELLKYSKAFEDFIQQYPLRPNSFYKGYFYNYLTNLKQFNPDKFFPNATLKKNMENDVWYAKSVPANEQQIIENHIGFFKGLYEGVQHHLKKHLKQYIFHKLVARNIYSIAVLNELLKEMEVFKQEQNIKHISEFNQAIADIIRKGAQFPFIYERLGERYKHFLIDEFQDTSTMQWHNLCL